jgi:hypothetical protein
VDEDKSPVTVAAGLLLLMAMPASFILWLSFIVSCLYESYEQDEIAMVVVKFVFAPFTMIGHFLFHAGGHLQALAVGLFVVAFISGSMLDR